MKWSMQQVKEYYDANWHINLSKLAELSGWTRQDLKEVLLSD